MIKSEIKRYNIRLTGRPKDFLQAALSSDKIGKYEYLTEEETLRPRQYRTKKRLNPPLLYLERHWKSKQKQLICMVKNKFRN